MTNLASPLYKENNFLWFLLKDSTQPSVLAPSFPPTVKIHSLSTVLRIWAYFS